MADLTLDQPVAYKKENLGANFFITGVVTLFLLVTLVTFIHYRLARSAIIKSVSAVMVEQIDNEFKLLHTRAGRELSSNEAESVAELRLEKSARLLLDLHSLNSLSVMSRKQEIVWRSEAVPIPLPVEEQVLVVRLLSGAASYLVQDYDFSRTSTWMKAFKNEANEVIVWVSVFDDQGAVNYLLRLSANFAVPFAHARRLAFRVLVMTLCGSLILIFVLSFSFRRGINTIKAQEKKLGHQVLRLSNLLSVNRLMQESIKTASARAVELNEQFLRRVGADLHDGPAQMIGYSVLRLNEVSRKEESEDLGQEFHAVKEALEESLEEIRGISSGLVLPELAELDLEQCLNKVVTLHSTKSKAEVAQYYSGLPGDIPLPIKITAYRFVQEGLNNAEQHGQAEKCRLSAHVIDSMLTVSLRDNGVGFRKSKLTRATEGGHLGLVGLRDRIESLGGKLIINSELGVGTVLKFTIAIADDS